MRGRDEARGLAAGRPGQRWDSAAEVSEKVTVAAWGREGAKTMPGKS